MGWTYQSHRKCIHAFWILERNYQSICKLSSQGCKQLIHKTELWTWLGYGKFPRQTEDVMKWKQNSCHCLMETLPEKTIGEWVTKLTVKDSTKFSPQSSWRQFLIQRDKQARKYDTQTKASWPDSRSKQCFILSHNCKEKTRSKGRGPSLTNLNKNHVIPVDQWLII